MTQLWKRGPRRRPRQSTYTRFQGMADNYLSTLEAADLRRSGTSLVRLKFALGRDRFLEAAPKLPGGRYTNTDEVG